MRVFHYQLELSAATRTIIFVAVFALGIVRAVSAAPESAPISAKQSAAHAPLFPIDPDFFSRRAANGAEMSGADGTWAEVPLLRRAFHTAVYDSAREQMIIFGGENVTVFDDLWTFSLQGGPSWDQITPAVSPPARFLHSAIYDPVADRMVVFGGMNEVSYGDVWALSLAGVPAWEELAPLGPAPSPRFGASAVYDALRNRMLIFGGYDGSYVEDVWALSLAGTPAWTQLIASGSPARFLHTAVYDTARDRIVIFGGANGTALNDVWALELSGTPAWSQLAPTGTPPSSRIGSTAIYVESDIIAIFGGSDGTNLNDAWILTLSEPAWTQINGAGAPPSRAFHSAVYEHSSERMVVFGGADGLDEPRYADVWSLSLTGNSWMQLETDLHPARAFHSSTHDTGRDRMVIFGGKDNGGVPYHDDTWQLSLAGNAEHWQPIATSGLPPAARAEHTAIYDPARERMIVFGGLSAFYVHNDLFELSLAGAPEWAQLAPGGAPSGRYRHAAVYDPVRDRMLVFGGNEWNSLLNEVWTLSLSGPAVWQQLLPIGQPPSPRSGHGMVYDSSRDRVIVFGGDDGDYLNDTWALSLSGAPEWLELLPVGQVPSGRCAPIVYDSLRDRIVAFGGSNGSVLADVWALNLSGTPAWNQLSPSGPQPPGRYGQTAFFDTFRHRMIMFGGTDATLVMHDTWALTGNSLSTGVVPTPIPSGDVLGPCYPNPFNPRVTIPFQLHDGGIASIAVYDVSGKHVRTLLRVWKGPGTHSVIWEGIDEAGQQVSSGVYFCRLLTGRSTATQKFVLLK